MKWWLVVPFALLTIVALAGCSAASSLGETRVEAQAPQQNGTVVPVVQASDDGVVIAEGIVVPARASYLSFELPGELVEVAVKAGDQVQSGDVLAQLDARELDLALRSAEQDVVAQEAAQRQLRKGASEKVIARTDKANADQTAQAEVALRAQELQLEKARQEDPSIAVAAAQARVNQLELGLAKAQAQGTGPSRATAEVALERARIALADTQDEYDKALDRPWEDQAIRDVWTKRLEQAQLDYRAAQAGLDGALDARRAHEVGLRVLSAQIEEARTQLAQARVAQDTYSTTIEILAEEVEAARLQLQALRTWDNPYRDPASGEEISQAETLLEKARVAVERLRVQREDATLTAPFAGTVVEVDADPGDQVSPGQVVVILATLDQLEVHTTDLSELEVGQIEVGDRAVVRVDAFPSHELSGRVTDIALQAQDYRGDTVYQVTVALGPVEERLALRWGMTALVEILGQ
jgi:multidrug resistance efflux pump